MFPRFYEKELNLGIFTSEINWSKMKIQLHFLNTNVKDSTYSSNTFILKN